MLISDIVRNKAAGSPESVVSIAPDEPVTAVLTKLAEHRVGALLVLEDGTLAGIVSERDVVRHLHEHGAAVLDGPVADIMTRDVVSCAPKDSVNSVAATMTERRFRHLPVMDGDSLVGVVSIGDVVFSRMRELEQDREHLEQYITG